MASVVQPKEQIEELQMLSTGAELVFFPTLHLSKQHRQILTLLLKREQAHEEVVYAMLYSNRPLEERPEPQTVATVFSAIRGKLRPFGVTIEKVDRAWRLTEENKQRLRELTARTEPARPAECRIEKGIPIPEKGRRPLAYPLEQLEVGDSFLVPFSELGRARNAIKNYRRWNPGRNFVSRKTLDGLRIWRTE